MIFNVACTWFWMSFLSPFKLGHITHTLPQTLSDVSQWGDSAVFWQLNGRNTHNNLRHLKSANHLRNTIKVTAYQMTVSVSSQSDVSYKPLEMNSPQPVPDQSISTSYPPRQLQRTVCSVQSVPYVCSYTRTWIKSKHVNLSGNRKFLWMCDVTGRTKMSLPAGRGAL